MAKSSRRRQDLPVERPRTNTPLLFLMLLLVPLFGGYYNFSVLAWGAALLLLLGWTVHSTGALRLPMGVEAWCLYGLCACHLLTVPFGVSWGMAFTGFLRTAVWALFFIYAASFPSIATAFFWARPFLHLAKPGDWSVTIITTTIALYTGI